MRFEATLPERRGKALVELAQELGISKSQLMDEALSLFLKVVLEAKRGKRLALLQSEMPVQKGSCELITPSLALLEWTAHRKMIELNPHEFENLIEAHENPPEPTEALKKAMRKHG